MPTSSIQVMWNNEECKTNLPWGNTYFSGKKGETTSQANSAHPSEGTVVTNVPSSSPKRKKCRPSLQSYCKIWSAIQRKFFCWSTAAIFVDIDTTTTINLTASQDCDLLRPVKCTQSNFFVCDVFDLSCKFNTMQFMVFKAETCSSLPHHLYYLTHYSIQRAPIVFLIGKIMIVLVKGQELLQKQKM